MIGRVPNISNAWERRWEFPQQTHRRFADEASRDGFCNRQLHRGNLKSIEECQEDRDEDYPVR